MNITLQQIKDAHPCKEGWHKVLKANGGASADLNKPFKLESIIDSNGLADTLWVLDEVLNRKDIISDFACDCALQIMPSIKEFYSEEQYNSIKSCLLSAKISSADLNKARLIAAYAANNTAGSNTAAETATEAVYLAIYLMGCYIANAASNALFVANAATGNTKKKTQSDCLRKLLNKRGL